MPVRRGASAQEAVSSGTVRLVVALEPAPTMEWIDRFLAARAHDVTRRVLIVLGHPHARVVATVVVPVEQVAVATRGLDRMIERANA